MKTTKRWKYLGVFLAALLVSTGIHWVWHLLEAQWPEFGTLGPKVITCQPPFCEEPDQERPASAPIKSLQVPDDDYSTGAYGEAAAPISPPVVLPDDEVTEPPSSAGYTLHNASHRVCVYDLAGNTGDQAHLMATWQQAALAKDSFRPELVVYTDARKALEDFKEGKCQAAWLPGGLDDSVLPALDTLEALGAVPTYQHARVLAIVLSAENDFTQYVRDDQHVLMGLLFSGPAYILFNKPSEMRALRSRMPGISFLTTNTAQAHFATLMGATPAHAALISAGGRFNNGSVDAMFAPLEMVPWLELDQGLKQGGVYAQPFYYASYRLVAEAEQFSDEDQAWSRTFFADQLAHYAEQSETLEQDVLASLPTIQPDPKERAELESMLQAFRVTLRDEGVYDKRILSLMRKVRCKLDTSRQECLGPVE